MYLYQAKVQREYQIIENMLITFYVSVVLYMHGMNG
jgi:hypothetical protein